MANLDDCLTYSNWVPLSCSAVELLQPRRHLLEQGPPTVLFWANHPIRYVYLAGNVCNLKFYSTKQDKRRVEFELDDGTGPSAPVLIFQADEIPCDESQFVEVYGTLSVYHKRTGVIAIDVRVCPPNLRRELDLKFEALRVQTELLARSDPLPALEPAGSSRGFVSLSRLPSEMSAHPKFRLIDSI